MKKPTKKQIDKLLESIDEMNKLAADFNNKAEEIGYFCRVECQVADYHEEYLEECEENEEEPDPDWEPEDGWFPSTC